jgi:hypothetical protein
VTARAEPHTLPVVALRRYAYPAAVAAVVAATTLLFVWDAFHYDWLRGYDAWHNWRYSEVIRFSHRLPNGETETAVWHTPPLFFAVAAAIQRFSVAIGTGNAQKAVQVLDALSAAAVAACAFLLARELFPRSRAIPLLSLAFAAAMPVLIRVGVMYHPEPLGTLLAMAALVVLVRALARDRTTLAAGVAAGALVGLAELTRGWAIAIFVGMCATIALHALFIRSRAPLRMLAVVAVLGILIPLPWYVHQQREYGSPFAFNRPAPAVPFFERRPLSFYTDLELHSVFTAPYVPFFRNKLLPTVYTDWWGDYWRYFEVPKSLAVEPTVLPDKYATPRILQSYVGVLPTILIFAGFAAAAVVGVRRRSAALLAPPLVVSVLVAMYLVFQTAYPHSDGDTTKSPYLLDALVPVSVFAAWSLAWLAGKNRLVLAALALVFADLLFLDVRFIVL